MHDLSTGTLLQRTGPPLVLVLALIIATGCAPSVARPGPSSVTEDAHPARLPEIASSSQGTDRRAISDNGVERCFDEDTGTLQNADGCPDLDREDACPTTPEDLDTFEDEDGCPDPDNDGDAIADLLDRCPLAAEDFDGDQDEDGCPEHHYHPVYRDPTPRFMQTTYFAPGSAAIRPRSVPILDTIAKTLIEHPDILELRIEGHADDHGDSKRDLEISRQRAEAVNRHLIAYGVRPGRLTLQHHGADKPRCDEAYREREELTRSECRAYNRRVEYRVVRRQTEAGPVFE